MMMNGMGCPCALGVSGLGDGVLGSVLGAAGPIEVGTAFPPFSQTYDPSQPSAPVQSQGSGVAAWLNAHVFRTYVSVGGQRVYDAGAGASDYSQVAAAGAVVAGLGTLGLLAWVLWRAFGPRQRRLSNPRRARPTTYHVARRRVA